MADESAEEPLGAALLAALDASSVEPRRLTGTLDSGGVSVVNLLSPLSSLRPQVGLFIGNRRGVGVNFCGGQIGKSGFQMCVLPVENVDVGRCTIQSHVKKVTFPSVLAASEEGVFIRSTAKYVNISKWWRRSEVAEFVDDTVTQPNRSVDEWEMLLDTSKSSEAPLGAARVRLFEERVQRASVYAVTPRLKRRRYRSDDEEDDVAAKDLWTAFSPAAGDEFKDLKSELWPQMVNNVESLRRDLKSTEAAFGSLQTKVGEDVDSLELKTVTLEKRVGDRPADAGATSLWQEFERMSLTVDELVASEFTEERVKAIADSAAKEGLRQEVINGDVFKFLMPGYLLAKRFSEEVGNNQGDLLESRLSVLESGTVNLRTAGRNESDRLNKIQRRVERLEAGGVGSPAPGNTGGVAGIESLGLGVSRGGFTSARSNPIGSTSGGSAGGFGGGSGSGGSSDPGGTAATRLRSVVTALESLEASLTIVREDLEEERQQNASLRSYVSSLEATSIGHSAELATIQAALESHTVTIGGETFASRLQVLSFVATNRMSEMSVSAIDVVSFLQLATNEVADTAQAVSEQADSKKAGYEDQFQAVVATSYQLVLPTFFGGASAKKNVIQLGKEKSPLPALVDFAAFDDHSTQCPRVLTLAALPTLTKSIKGAIKHSGMSSICKALLTEMVSTSSSFLKELFTFIGEFYQELTHAYHTDAVESWHLVGSIVKQLFVDLAMVRGSVRYVKVTTQRAESVATDLLWASLQAHHVMESYLLANFRGHPNVAPVVTLHLYSHRVPRSTFTLLENRVTNVAKEVKTVKTIADKAASAAAKG